MPQVGDGVDVESSLGALDEEAVGTPSHTHNTLLLAGGGRR